MPKFLNNIDLVKNELQNARIQNLASAPGSPVDGQIYYDTGANAFKGRANGAWVTMQGGGSVTSVTNGDSTITVAGTSTDPTVAVATGGITNTQVSASAAIAYSKLALTGSILNADINASAAIAYSKLALTGSILNADINASAAIAYSKLSLGTSIVNTDISASAAIAYSKLALTGAIVNADISVSAAIVYSKLSLAGSIVNADIAGGAAIALSKLATDPLARANHTGTQLAATVSDFDTQVRTSRLDQMAVPTGSVSMNSQKITSLLDPTSAQDAATKSYVDALSNGLDVKASVRVATTTTLPANSRSGNVITASGNGALAAIDGVTLVLNDRLLVKNEATGANNGIYYVSVVGTGGTPFTLTRATDADSSAEVTGGMYTFVEEGTTNADSGWILTTDNAITLNTTALTFAQFTGAGQITAGNGLTKTGNTLDVVGTTNRISVAADAIDISTSYVGQATITTLGTITTGTWTGTTIAVANGGTGGTTAATGRGNLGATGVYSAAGTGTGTSFTIALATHGLGSAGNDYCDIVAECYDISAASAVKVEADVTINKSTGAVTFTFAASQTLTNFRFTIIGK